MLAYIILLFCIYTTYFLCRLSTPSIEKSNRAFLLISFISIYLLCILRDYSVGRDIPGYIETYENAGAYQLMDASWTHMEVGYVTFMQLCSLIGLTPRLFFCLVYFIMLYPIYKTIKKHSYEPLLSVIIFVCFQFLTFDLSGIRQGLAISICMLSLSYAGFKSKKDFALWILLIALAISFHSSSAIFLFVPIIIRLKFNLTNVLFSLLALLVAPRLTNFFLTFLSENELSAYTFDDRLLMGGLLVFMFAILSFIMYTCYRNRKKLNYITLPQDRFTLTQYLFLLIAGMFFTLSFNVL